MVDGVPGLGVDGREEVLGLRVPGPPQVGRQVGQRGQRRGQDGTDGESTNRTHRTDGSRFWSGSFQIPGAFAWAGCERAPAASRRDHLRSPRIDAFAAGALAALAPQSTADVPPGGRLARPPSHPQGCAHGRPHPHPPGHACRRPRPTGGEGDRGRADAGLGDRVPRGSRQARRRGGGDRPVGHSSGPDPDGQAPRAAGLLRGLGDPRREGRGPSRCRPGRTRSAPGSTPPG